MSRYRLDKQGDKYVIIDKFPYEKVIETFYDDEYDIAKETYELYKDEEKSSSQLNKERR